LLKNYYLKNFTDKKQANCEITKIKEEALEYLSVQGLFCEINQTQILYVKIIDDKL